MKSFILASLLVVAVSASLLEELGAKFQAFKLEHDKTYISQVEETKRFAIFQDNLKEIEEHNALYEQGLVTYKKGINQFSDMTQEEFEALLTLHVRPTINGTEHVLSGNTLPTFVDWRKKGYVTGVKNQKQCGSCWAFSVTGATEGAYYHKHHKLVSLSEQQLVDCTRNINQGCDGGYMDKTFNYIKQKGLESESSYAYTAKNGNCKYSSSKVVTKVSSYVTIHKNEKSLLDAVATKGPVSVAIDATHLSSYSSGIFSSKSCTRTKLNHGVLIVGYGTENGVKYWIVKNSWGTSWGIKGYFKLLRGENACGVAEDDSYPVIK